MFETMIQEERASRERGIISAGVAFVVLLLVGYFLVA
jgi:hypothetical protein